VTTRSGKNETLRLERLFQALADRTRLRLLNLMAEQEICVCYFVQVLNAPQSKISRHLAYLRNTGIVQARRDGKWMHYRLKTPTDAHEAAILQSALAALRNNSEVQEDVVRLEKACCGSRSLAKLIGAPMPA
jgi:ArsR family transcriptional regulator